MPGLSRLSRRGKLLLALGVTVIVGALVVSLVLVRLRSSDDHNAADVAPAGAGDRLLQSVRVAMQPDGALNQIDDTVVISRANGGQADTFSTSHDPSQVVDDLPVRVVTSYRTEKSSGSNLADLAGYTGRVTIDLSVQNLTVKPQQISYDVGGSSRTATAMVGAPLTVVASASLPGVDPQTVVTSDDTDGDTAATNGVLSRSADKVTQVQWATILAPPQLDATANLQLVLDAKDFKVPSVDLSVQPGLVTDPSVGALVDAAFNPKNSDELALETRTIQVIGDVNDVLARASGQISKVRKTLDSTSKTLGTKTVASLQADTKQIDSSLKQSDKNLDALNTSLRSSLKETSSSTLEKLADTVDQIDALLGDTSQSPPEVKVTGTGCAAKVSAPVSGGSVYASLLQVTAQLNAYADTTRGCRDELTKAIRDAIGPEHPASQCNQENADSVTCAIDAVRTVSDDIDKAQQISAGLDPKTDFAASRKTVTDLIGQLGELAEATSDDPDDSAVTKQLEAASAAVTNARDSLGDVRSALGDIHDGAAANKNDVDAMVEQNQAAADQLCTVIGDGTQANTLTSAQVEEFRSYLVTRSCPDANGNTTPLTPPGKYGEALATRLQKQSAEWADLAEETDTSDSEDGIGKSLAAVSSSLDDADTALDAAGSALGDVHSATTKAVDSLQELDSELGTVQDTYTTAKTQLDDALTAAAKKASSASLDNAITQVYGKGKASSEQLSDAFDKSAKGLESAAKALEDNGSKAIDQQRNDLAKTQQQAGKSLSTALTGSLGQISGDISSATRDLSGTRSQLTRDLTNILLDLGDPQIKGSGVIGTIRKGATAAGSADYQLASATDQISAYGSVRQQDLAGIMLRQAQAEAALQRQAELPAFAMELPATVQHRTVYTFHLDGGR